MKIIQETKTIITEVKSVITIRELYNFCNDNNDMVNDYINNWEGIILHQVVNPVNEICIESDLSCLLCLYISDFVNTDEVTDTYFIHNINQDFLVRFSYVKE